MTRDSIDKVWQKLAIAMFSGGLGPTVYMVKVITLINVLLSKVSVQYRSAPPVKTARTSTWSACTIPTTRTWPR